MHTKKKFLHTNAYFAFLICRLVHRLHEHMAVLLADPTKITHRFTHNNIWQEFGTSSNKMLCMLQQRFLQLHKKPYKNAKLSKIKNNLIEAVFNTLLPFYFDWMGVSLYHHVCNLEYALVVIWHFLQHNFVETL